jgi:hypothetical protein
VDSPTSFGEGLGLKVKEFSKTSKLYLKSL